MINDTSEPQSAVLGLFDPTRTQRLAAIGRGVLRYGLVALLLLWGSFKFAAFEAEGIRPLVEHSPLLRWLYPLLGVRGTSSLIGVVELTAGLLICARRWRPALSAVGSLLATVMKDIMLLGAALYTAAEALEAARHQRGTTQVQHRKEILWTP